MSSSSEVVLEVEAWLCLLLFVLCVYKCEPIVYLLFCDLSVSLCVFNLPWNNRHEVTLCG